MKWLKRLFNAPMIIRVHWLRSWFKTEVELAEESLEKSCKVESIFGLSNKAAIKKETKRLEKALESLADTEARMNSLWN